MLHSRHQILYFLSKRGGDTHVFYNIISFFFTFDIHTQGEITIEHKEETLHASIKMYTFIPSAFLATPPLNTPHSIFIKSTSNIYTNFTSFSISSPSSVMSSSRSKDSFSDPIITSSSKSSQTSSPLSSPRFKKKDCTSTIQIYPPPSQRIV